MTCLVRHSAFDQHYDRDPNAADGRDRVSGIGYYQSSLSTVYKGIYPFILDWSVAPAVSIRPGDRHVATEPRI